MLNRAIYLLILLLAACTQPTPPLRIGTNVWPGYEPLYLARNIGLLVPEQAQLVEYTSASQVMEAFADGAIEAATLTLDEALLLQQKGFGARIVLVMDYSNGADVLLAKPEIGSLSALRGKRVGVENTALGAYMLNRALSHAGIPYRDIKPVALEVHAHQSAYLTDKVDAVVTFEPVAGKLLAAGAQNLFDSSQIPGEILDVLVVRDDLNASRLPQVQALLKAWFGALEYLRLHPAKAAEHMAPRLHLDAADTLQALEGIRLPGESENRKLLRGSPAPLVGQINKLAGIMLEQHLLHDADHLEALLNDTLLERLYP